MLGALIAIVVVAAVASIGLGLVAIRLARGLGYVDAPGSEAHKLQTRAVPYGGGAAMAVAVALAYGIGERALAPLPADPRIGVVLLGALALFALGLIDDRRPLGALPKLAAQALVCAATVWRADLAVDSLRPYGAVAWAVAWLWMLVVTNAYNLLDHADGLAASVAGVSACVLLSGSLYGGDLRLATLWLALIGALAGFLMWNRPSARLYMGDAGSLPLGFLIAAGTLTVVFWPSGEGGSPLSMAQPLLITAIPLFDTAVVVLKRLRRRQPMLRGDRRHISHRMARLGMSPGASLLTIVALQAALAAGAIALRDEDLVRGVVVLLQAGAILLAVVLLETARDDA